MGNRGMYQQPSEPNALSRRVLLQLPRDCQKPWIQPQNLRAENSLGEHALVSVKEIETGQDDRNRPLTQINMQLAALDRITTPVEDETPSKLYTNERPERSRRTAPVKDFPRCVKITITQSLVTSL